MRTAAQIITKESYVKFVHQECLRILILAVAINVNLMIIPPNYQCCFSFSLGFSFTLC